MICKNLTIFFSEFKKYRETKKDIAKEENYYDYVLLNSSRDIDDDKLDGVGINLEQGKVLIDIGISQIGLKQEDWVNNYESKIEKILQDIWTTGEIKDTYGLDLNWPTNHKKNKKVLTDNRVIVNQKDNRTNNSIISFCQENLNFIILGIGIISLIFLIIRSRKRK